MSSLRIGLVTDCYVPQVGGIEMQVHDLAQRLQRAGHEVVVITPTAGPSVVDGVRVRRLDVPLLPFNIPFTPKSIRMTTELLIDEQVDVAHFHGGVVSPLSYVAAYTSQRAGIPTVITAHCLWSYATPVFRVLDAAFHWSDWNVVFSAVSGVAAAPIRKIVGRKGEVLVLPNGIDYEDWTVSAAPHDPDRLTIVSVMRLAPRKRPLHLLKMMREVRERVPEEVALELIVVGEGPERPSLERFIRANGLGDVVSLPGRLTREQIRDLFAESDIFVAPANLESFGIAALEARCAGLPVVAKARTGIREFIDDGREGLLAGSDRDMTDQLIRLIRDHELRQLIAKHNLDTPVSLDWDTVVAQNVAAYGVAMAESTSG